jgi:hypothetical protein
MSQVMLMIVSEGREYEEASKVENEMACADD